jgi:hypothetical protein
VPYRPASRRKAKEIVVANLSPAPSDSSRVSLGNCQLVVMINTPLFSSDYIGARAGEKNIAKTPTGSNE